MIGDTLKDIKDIHSVSVKEGKLLYKLAKECTGKGVIVEIGSWKGYSTIWLAKGSQSGECVEVYAIDPHIGSEVHRKMYGVVKTYPEFIKNIAKVNVENIVVPMVMTSKQAGEQWGDLPIELLWIDGDHEAVDVDFDIWYSYVIDGGIIALHDTTMWPSKVPYKVAIEKLYKSGDFVDVKRVMSITYAKKIDRLTRKNKIKNLCALYRRYIYQLFIPYYIKGLIIAVRILGKVRK